MYDCFVTAPLLFPMHCGKRIALWEAVWRYLALYNKSWIDNHRKEIQRNCWNTVALAGIRISHGWINKVVVATQILKQLIPKMHSLFTIFYFHFLVNSIKTDILVVSHFLLMFGNCRDRFNVHFILKEYLHWRNLCFPPFCSCNLFCKWEPKSYFKISEKDLTKPEKNIKKSKVSGTSLQ